MSSWWGNFVGPHTPQEDRFGSNLMADKDTLYQSLGETRKYGRLCQSIFSAFEYGRIQELFRMTNILRVKAKGEFSIMWFGHFPTRNRLKFPNISVEYIVN